MNRFLKNVVFYAILIGSGTASHARTSGRRTWFPRRATSSVALHDGFKDHSIWIGIRVSMERVVAGYLISVALGFILSLILLSSKTLQDTFGRLFASLQLLPSIGWLPLAILWYGLSDKAILFVIVMGSVFSIT